MEAVGKQRRRDEELAGRVKDRGVVEPGAVRVVVDDVQVLEVADLGDRRGERLRELGGRRAQRGRGCGDRGADAEDREAAHAQVLELEALTAAEEEARGAADAEGLRQAAVHRNADRHGRFGDIDVDAPGRQACEAHRPRDGEDVGGADDDGAVVSDVVLLIEAGGELLDARAGAEVHADRGLLACFVDEAVAVVVDAVPVGRQRGERVLRQVDRLVDRLAGVVQPHGDRAADGEPVEPDQGGRAVGDDRVQAATARCRGLQLHETETGVRDQ